MNENFGTGDFILLPQARQVRSNEIRSLRASDPPSADSQMLFPHFDKHIQTVIPTAAFLSKSIIEILAAKKKKIAEL
ncbi:MAG: hypothetical protein WBE34_02755 [Candidatus Nitrosopolaris sp.]